MLKVKTSFAPIGAIAAVTLATAVSAAFAQETLDETYWYADGDMTLPEGQLWVNSYGECWQSEPPDGPRNLPPCAEAVPEEVTVSINFEFDKYLVPENVVNQEVIPEIDDYISKIKGSEEEEYVTVVGHTDAKGSDEYNMALGMRRAEAVRDYIVSQGYPATNMAPPVSEGESELLPDVDPYSVLQRRVVLTKTER